MLTQIQASFHPRSPHQKAPSPLRINPQLQAKLRVNHVTQRSFLPLHGKASEQASKSLTINLSKVEPVDSRTPRQAQTNFAKRMMSSPGKSSYQLYKDRQKMSRLKQQGKMHHPSQQMAIQKPTTSNRKSFSEERLRKYSSLTINDALHHNLDSLPHSSSQSPSSNTRNFIRTTDGKRVAVDSLALLSKLKGKISPGLVSQRRTLEPSLVTITHDQQQTRTRHPKAQFSSRPSLKTKSLREKRGAKINDFRPWSGVKGEVNLLLDQFIFQ